ncbi:hypothetical protein BC835DRAFT_1347579 [Cytidiella melzeri]|nr:hypothetical protein BC835DRAFT_1347579 [Cytidiella melzeri]
MRSSLNTFYRSRGSTPGAVASTSADASTDHPPYEKRSSSTSDDGSFPAEKGEGKGSPVVNSTSDLNIEQSHGIAGPSTWAAASQPDQATLSRSEDPLNSLRNYNTVILLDDSGSMWTKAQGILSRRTRWKVATQAVGQLAQKAMEYDSNGIDLLFINDCHKFSEAYNLTREAEVDKVCKSIRNSHLATPTGKRVEDLLQKYQFNLEKGFDKKLNLLIITAGAATDKVALKIAIQRHAQYLDQNGYPLDQSGIQFIQVGNDKEATAFLQELDNDLRAPWTESGNRPPRDIVDTVPYSGGEMDGATLIKILLGAINRKTNVPIRRRDLLV